MTTHVDEEVIAAVALGDPDVTARDAEHVRRCPRCGALLADFHRLQFLLRSPDETGEHPLDPGLWDRIAAATSAEPALAPPVDLDQRRAGRPSAGPRRGPALLAAAALACVLAGLGIGRLVWSTPDPPEARVLASAPLSALDGSRTLGDAQLLDEAGRTELRVAAAASPPSSGFVEVWLINEDGKRMVSLGVLDAPGAVFAVPPGALDAGYRIVDLSRESYDGDAGHSGDSIMRGSLPV